MSEFKISNNKLLSLYVDQVMASKGVDGLSLDEQRELKSKLVEKLDYDIQEAMLDALSDDKLEELDRRLDEGMTDAELELFFEYNSPEIEMKSVLTDVLERFREDYLTASTDNEQEGVESQTDWKASGVAVAPGRLLGDLEGGF